MSFNSDVDKMVKYATDLASDHIHKVLEEAKREMGPDGRDIKIKQASGPRAGDKVGIGNVEFPSEDVKARFLKIVERKMR